MGFRIEHAPSAALIGDVAAYGGRGQGIATILPIRERQSDRREEARQFDTSTNERRREFNADMTQRQRELQARVNMAMAEISAQAQQRGADRAQQTRMALFQAQKEAAAGNREFAERLHLTALQNYFGQQSGFQDFSQRSALQQQNADLRARDELLMNAPAAAPDAITQRVGPPGQQQVAPGQFVLPDPDDILTNFGQVVDNQAAALAPGQRQIEKLTEQIQRGDPQAIQEGLGRGILRFSPEQNTEIKKIQRAMDRVDRDDSLNPIDRARAQRMLAQRLHSIRPVQVPVEQRPIDLNERFQKSVAAFTDPRDGKSYLGAFDRNGRPFLLTTPQDEIDVAAAKADATMRARTGSGGAGGAADTPAKLAQQALTVRERAAVDPIERTKLILQARKLAVDEIQADDETGNKRAPSTDEVQAKIKWLIEQDEATQRMLGGADPDVLRQRLQSPAASPTAVPAGATFDEDLRALGNAAGLSPTVSGGPPPVPQSPSPTEAVSDPKLAQMDAESYQELTGKPAPPQFLQETDQRFSAMAAEFDDKRWRELVADLRTMKVIQQAAQDGGPPLTQRDVAMFADAEKKLLEFREQRSDAITGYNQIPKGSRYKAPDGTIRIKR